MPARAAEPPQMRLLRVNGVDLSYLEEGAGAPVVFVHGSFADLRFWEPQRQAIAQQYRFIAYTRRYHGTTPWADDGRNYSAATHAADRSPLAGLSPPRWHPNTLNSCAALR
jgi:pimeloyl-ACP methyl ester carboxylesterase